LLHVLFLSLFSLIFLFFLFQNGQSICKVNLLIKFPKPLSLLEYEMLALFKHTSFLNDGYNQCFLFCKKKKYSHSLTNRKGSTSHFVAAGKAENARHLHIKDLKKFLLVL